MPLGLVKGDRAWMVSATARRRFLVSALTTLVGFAILVPASYIPGIDQAVSHSTAMKIAALFATGATCLAILVLLHGMLWYCMVLEPSKWYSKALWSVIFFVTIPLGVLAYYFFVYRRQVA